MGIYSEKVIQEVNDQLDPRAVLDLIGYHTEKVQESAETFRGFCPIHRETVFRTLIIDKTRRTFRCMYSLCKGAAGGTLVELYALAREIPVEKALEELAEHFHLDVHMPVDPEYLAKQSEVAENYLELGFFDDAEKVYRQIIEAEPQYERAIRGLIQVYEHSGDMQALGHQHAALAQMLLARGERSAAYEHVRAWAEYNPESPRAHYLLADYLNEQGEPEAALEEYMTAADLYTSEGDFPAAIDAYKQADALRLDLVDVVPHVLQVYEQMGKPGEAVGFLAERAEAAVLHAEFARAADLLAQALELKPDDPELRSRFCEIAILADSDGDWIGRVFESAEWFTAAGMPERAVQVYERILDAQPANEEALSRLGALYASMGKQEEGLGLRVRTARMAFESRDYARAQHELEAVLAQVPDHTAALELLAEVHLAAGRPELACEQLAKLARVHLDRHDYAKALNLFDRVLNLAHGSTHWRLERAAVLEAWGATGNVRARQQAAAEFEALGDEFAQGDPQKALELYLRAEACVPAPAALLMKIARCHARLGQLDAAREYLSRACDEFLATGEAETAVAGARELAALAPADHALQSYVVELLQLIGRTREAVETAMQLADEAARHGDPQRVVEYLNRALALDPDFVPAIEALALHYHGAGDTANYCEMLLRLASANEQQGNAAGAVAALERLVDVHPEDVMALSRLATLYEKLGNVAKARACRLQLAELHHRRGALESEREILQELLAGDENDENVLAALIECEFALGNNEQACARAVQLARLQVAHGFAAQARATLEKAVAREPDDLAVNRLLFDLLRQLGAQHQAVERGLHLVELLQLYDQIDEAAQVFEQVTECAPNDSDLLHRHIAFLREIGRTQETREKLFAMARRMRAAGQFEAADGALKEIEASGELDIAELEEFLALYEQWGRLDEFARRALELARLYAARGQDKKALALLRRAIKVTRGHTELRRELAELFAAQGRLPDALRELQALASSFAQAGKADEELAVLRRAAALAPTDTQVRLRLVDALQARGEREAAAMQLEDLAAVLISNKSYSEALGALDRLVAEYPARLSARRMRAEVYAALGQNERAEEDLNTFYIQSLLRQAEEYRAKGDLTREAATLREALKIVPTDEELMRRVRSVELEAGELDAACATTLELAHLLNGKGRREDALALLRETFALAPESVIVAEVLFDTLVAAGENAEAAQLGEQLAGLLLKAGQRTQAIATFERVLSVAPDAEEYDLRFAQFLERAGETERALERYLQAGQRAAARGDWETAAARYREALRLDPQAEPAHEGMAEASAHLGKTDEQVEWLARLARVVLDKGRPDAAVDALRRALVADPSRLDLRRWLVELLEQQGQIGAAVAELHALADFSNAAGQQAEALKAEERAVALAPNDPAARRRLAETLIMLNDVDRGVEQFEQLSQLYAEAGDFVQAIAVLEEAQGLAPARLSVRRLKADIYERMGDSARADEERRQFEVTKALQEAQAARDRGDFEAEKHALRRALEVAPQDESVWQLLMRCHRDLGDGKAEIEALLRLAEVQHARHGAAKARATLEQALGDFGRDERILRRLFDLARELGDDAAVRSFGGRLVEVLTEQPEGGAAALAVYDEMLAYAPHDAELYLAVADYCAQAARLGDALARLHHGADLAFAQGSLDACERLLLRALELSPGSTETLSRLVKLYERAGRTAEFERRMLELATALDESGDSAEAVATVRRLTVMSQDNVAARQLLVRLLTAAGQTHAAVEEQLALVGVLRQLGSASEAIEAAREAVAMSGGSVRARRMLADSLLAAGNTDAANNELEELAKLHIEAGQFTDALGVLDEIIERSPERTSSRILRAEVYAKLGEAEKALDEYRAISAAVTSGVVAAPAAPVAPAIPTLQIVPEYDFEHFVVGANNNFAYATALAVARAPAQAYNPLFIYSDVGLGKTHLVNAIANHILRENPQVRIIYTNSEDFTAEVVEAIQTNTINQFRARYKSVDLLIVDDVQFLAGKERAQEEFFHIFNALFQAKKQIVITSDRPPKDIARLENRLLSRFGAGVIVDIAPPDLETRIAILNREIQRMGIEILPEVVQLVAEHIDTNVRELKGALNQIVAMHTMQGKDISVENVQQMLESLYRRQSEGRQTEAAEKRRK